MWLLTIDDVKQKKDKERSEVNFTTKSKTRLIADFVKWSTAFASPIQSKHNRNGFCSSFDIENATELQKSSRSDQHCVSITLSRNQRFWTRC